MKSERKIVALAVILAMGLGWCLLGQTPAPFGFLGGAPAGDSGLAPCAEEGIDAADSFDTYAGSFLSGSSGGCGSWTTVYFVKGPSEDLPSIRAADDMAEYAAAAGINGSGAGTNWFNVPNVGLLAQAWTNTYVFVANPAAPGGYVYDLDALDEYEAAAALGGLSKGTNYYGFPPDWIHNVPRQWTNEYEVVTYPDS